MYQLFICLSIRDRVRDDLAEPPCRGPFPPARLVAGCLLHPFIGLMRWVREITYPS